MDEKKKLPDEEEKKTPDTHEEKKDEPKAEEKKPADKADENSADKEQPAVGTGSMTLNEAIDLAIRDFIDNGIDLHCHKKCSARSDAMNITEIHER